MDSVTEDKQQRQAWNISKITLLVLGSMACIMTLLMLGSFIYLSVNYPNSPALVVLKDWSNLLLGFIIGSATALIKTVADKAD